MVVRGDNMLNVDHTKLKALRSSLFASGMALHHGIGRYCCFTCSESGGSRHPADAVLAKGDGISPTLAKALALPC